MPRKLRRVATRQTVPLPTKGSSTVAWHVSALRIRRWASSRVSRGDVMTQPMLISQAERRGRIRTWRASLTWFVWGLSAIGFATPKTSPGWLTRLG